MNVADVSKRVPNTIISSSTIIVLTVVLTTVARRAMWLELGPDFTCHFLRRLTAFACSSVREYGCCRCVDRSFHKHCRCDPLIFATAARLLLQRWQQSVWYRPITFSSVHRLATSTRLRRVPFDAVGSSFHRHMLHDMIAFLDFQLLPCVRRRRQQVLHRMRGACVRALRCSTQWRARFSLLAAADCELQDSCPWWFKNMPDWRA